LKECGWKASSRTSASYWDGFVYAVGTPTNDTFRYASIIHGGPGALINDGDNEINGIMGTRADFQPPVPEPETYVLMLAGMGALGPRRAPAARWRSRPLFAVRLKRPCGAASVSMPARTMIAESLFARDLLCRVGGNDAGVLRDAR
jgi:hypothetical protein